MTVVAAIDRSPFAGRVVEVAADMAAALGEDLHVVHVLGQSEFVELERTKVQDTGQPIQMDRVREIGAEIAEEAGEALDSTYEPVGLVGEVASEVVRYATEQEASYIVIGGRKQTAVGKVLFGNTAQSVLLNAKRPVLTIMDREE